MQFILYIYYMKYFLHKITFILFYILILYHNT